MSAIKITVKERVNWRIDDIKRFFRFIISIKSFYKFYVDYEYDGDNARYIVQNYEEVLSNRTVRLSKPTYSANVVINELDRWYEEHEERE